MQILKALDRRTDIDCPLHCSANGVAVLCGFQATIEGSIEQLLPQESNSGGFL